VKWKIAIIREALRDGRRKESRIGVEVWHERHSTIGKAAGKSFLKLKTRLKDYDSPGLSVADNGAGWREGTRVLRAF